MRRGGNAITNIYRSSTRGSVKSSTSNKYHHKSRQSTWCTGRILSVGIFSFFAFIFFWNAEELDFPNSVSVSTNPQHIRKNDDAHTSPNNKTVEHSQNSRSEERHGDHTSEDGVEQNRSNKSDEDLRISNHAGALPDDGGSVPSADDDYEYSEDNTMQDDGSEFEKNNDIGAGHTQRPRVSDNPLINESISNEEGNSESNSRGIYDERDDIQKFEDHPSNSYTDVNSKESDINVSESDENKSESKTLDNFHETLNDDNGQDDAKNSEGDHMNDSTNEEIIVVTDDENPQLNETESNNQEEDDEILDDNAEKENDGCSGKSDTGDKFEVEGHDGEKDCSWVRDKDRDIICEKEGIKGYCPVSCGICPNADKKEDYIELEEDPSIGSEVKTNIEGVGSHLVNTTATESGEKRDDDNSSNNVALTIRDDVSIEAK